MAFPETLYTVRGPRGVGKSDFANALRLVLPHEGVRIDPRVMSTLHAVSTRGLDMDGAYDVAFDAVKEILHEPNKSVIVELEGKRIEQVERYAELARARDIRFGAFLLTASVEVCRERLMAREGGIGVVIDSEFTAPTEHPHEVRYNTLQYDPLELARDAMLRTSKL